MPLRVAAFPDRRIRECPHQVLGDGPPFDRTTTIPFSMCTNKKLWFGDHACSFRDGIGAGKIQLPQLINAANHQMLGDSLLTKHQVSIVFWAALSADTPRLTDEIKTRELLERFGVGRTKGTAVEYVVAPRTGMLVKNEDTTGTSTTRQGFCRNIRTECSGRGERTGIGSKGIVAHGTGIGIGGFDGVGGIHGSLSVWVSMLRGNLSTLPRIRWHLPDTHNLPRAHPQRRSGHRAECRPRASATAELG